MGLFDWIGNAAGVKAMQAGSDVLITRHTPLNALDIPSGWRRLADDVIRDRFLHAGDARTEFDAALLKLAIYWQVARDREIADAELLFGLCLDQIREAGEGQFAAAISLEVLGNTGH